MSHHITTAASGFTIALFGAPFAGPLGRILVWTIHKRTKKKTSYWPHTPEEVDALVSEKRDTHEVYFALAMPPAAKDLREDNRVESAEAAGIPGLWIEFDYDTPYRKKKGLPPDHELQVAIKTLPAPAPSLIVDSGGGFHCYWPFLDGPWIFQNEAERDEAQELVLGWQAELRRHVGFTVDSTHDLARVLRLPGTLNHKGDTPVDVRLLQDNGQGPTVEEWRAMATLWAPPAPNSSRNGSTSRGSERSSGRRVGASAALDVSPDRSPNADDKALLIQVLPDVDRVLKHDSSKMKGINDKSANGCDLSLASYAAQARWELQRMSDLLIEHRRHLHPESHPKADYPRPDYYERTFKRAYEKRQPTIEEIETEDLSELLSGLPVLAVRKVKESETSTKMPTYRIVTRPQGDPTPAAELLQMEWNREIDLPALDLPSIESLIDQKKFRAALAIQFHRYPPAWDTDVFVALVNRLLQLVVVVWPGHRLHPTSRDEVAQTLEWLEDYTAAIDKFGVQPGDSKYDEALTARVSSQKPFEMAGDWHIFAKHMADWLENANGVKLSIPALAARLKDLGLESDQQRIPSGNSRKSRFWRWSP